MKYTAKYFHDRLPEWKRKKDPILSRVFYRPLSFAFSAFFSNIGWTANMVSYLSAVVALIACACFVLGAPIAGAVLINMWLLLDCTDGNIARSVRKERYGDFADSMSSYICVGLMFCCMGFAAYRTGGALFAPGNPWVILMGALAGSSDSLMRLLYQKFLNSTVAQGAEVNRSEDPDQQGGINRIRMKVDAYVSLGGFLPLAVLLASIFDFLDVVVVLWLAYYGLTFVASALYLVRKTFKVNAADNDESKSAK
jgi:phosphatidylglycerophosphate synthase